MEFQQHMWHKAKMEPYRICRWKRQWRPLADCTDAQSSKSLHCAFTKSKNREGSNKISQMHELKWAFRELNFLFVCLFWGVTAQSTQWDRVECSQYTESHFYWITLLLGRLSPLKWLISLVRILSPETDKSSSWIWKGENDCRKYFMINLYERMLPTWWGSNPQPPDHQSDTHLTEPLRAVREWNIVWSGSL